MCMGAMGAASSLVGSAAKSGFAGLVPAAFAAQQRNATKRKPGAGAGAAASPGGPPQAMRPTPTAMR